tara:strand:+ start:1496 stop:1699 length:204 start_codon:yes stop_codon:yes gene_type:complete
MKKISKVKKVLDSNPTTAAAIVYLMYLAVILVIMTMSSCGSSKMYHLGTGKELPKSNCTGNYIFGNK